MVAKLGILASGGWRIRKRDESLDLGGPEKSLLPGPTRQDHAASSSRVIRRKTIRQCGVGTEPCSAS